uniref:Uncharacterized protein n=1 Tax=Trypanosoma vivax (strain Y486) TaxID=1055687 RepID=G0U2T8_TRYVY|nr:hypothetical protein TVY486_0904130 [Trypanosoma vivax Y486]
MASVASYYFPHREWTHGIARKIFYLSRTLPHLPCLLINIPVPSHNFLPDSLSALCLASGSFFRARLDVHAPLRLLLFFFLNQKALTFAPLSLLFSISLAATATVGQGKSESTSL